jgi:hypothetical protein
MDFVRSFSISADRREFHEAAAALYVKANGAEV